MTEAEDPGPDVVTEERGGVLALTFNRPKQLNALNAAIFGALADAVDTMIERDDLHALLIKSTGRYFSAGLDIHGGNEQRPDGTAESPQLTPEFGGDPIKARRWYRGMRRTSVKAIAESIEVLEKPVIVAIHAPCLGGALEFALSADFRLAAASSEFGLPEVLLGVLPGSGGMSRLTRLVGPAWARWLVLANQRVSAERALTMGLVQDVYPDDEFEERVWAFATHMATMPPQLFGLGKLAIDLCADLDRYQGRNVEVIANGQLFLGAEYPEMLSQFAAAQAAKRASREGGL